jgi:hypothetical protein
MLSLALSGVLDIKKIQGHYPAKALLMEDYAPLSPVTIVTHTVTITQTPSTFVSFECVTQAAFDKFRGRRRHKSTTDLLVD